MVKCLVCNKEVNTDGPHYRMSKDEYICSKECFYKNFWDAKVRWKENNDKTEQGERVARIEGVHYVIGDENDTSTFRGHGGRKFTIKFLDSDETITTTNLWRQGVIPEEYKELLPDNAIFCEEVR